MKKSNLVTLLSLCFIIVAVILFMFLWKTPSASSGTETESNSTTQSNIITTPKDTSEDISSTKTEDSSEASTSITDNITSKTNNNTSMGDALFIGDSRTVGLMEYADIDGADYFCTVGMSVYNINVSRTYIVKIENGVQIGPIEIAIELAMFYGRLCLEKQKHAHQSSYIA